MKSIFEKASFIRWIESTKVKDLIPDYEGDETLDELQDDYYSSDMILDLLEGAFRARVVRKEN